MPGLLTLRALGPAAAAANGSAQRNGSVGVSSSRTDKVRDESRGGHGAGSGVAPSFASTRGPKTSPGLHSTTAIAPGAGAGADTAAPYRSNLHRQLLQHQLQQQQAEGTAEDPRADVRGEGRRTNGLDIFRRLGGFDYSSSGSEHEPNSVCLAEMVYDYIEEDLDVGNCGRARCNCAHNCSSTDGAVRNEANDSKSSVGGGTADVLVELTSCVNTAEKNILASVSSALKAVDESEGSGEAEFLPDRSSTKVKRSVMASLRSVGYNAALCKSRWDNVGGFPGGVYEYVDIISGGGVAEISKTDRFLVDIDFQSQFKIARPTAQYTFLLQSLPAVFVGRADRLQQIVNIMCDASKRSLKKSGMHLPPWRKPEYIRGRWFSAYRRTTNEVTTSEELIVGQTDLRRSRWCSKFAEEMERSFLKAPDRRTMGAWRNCDMDEDNIREQQQGGGEGDYAPEGQVRGGKNLVGMLDLANGSTATQQQRSGVGALVTEWVPPAVKPRTAAERAAAGKVGGLVFAMKEFKEDLPQLQLPEVVPKAIEKTTTSGGLSRQMSMLAV